jgi:hypothetical protein
MGVIGPGASRTVLRNGVKMPYYDPVGALDVKKPPVDSHRRHRVQEHISSTDTKQIAVKDRSVG